MCKQSVIKLLGDRLHLVCRVVTEALKKDSDYSKNADVLTSRSTSSIRNDHMVRSARELLLDNGFIHLKHGQRNLFDFRGELLVHFKKLSTAFLPSNYMTQTALQLFGSGTAEGLPGIPPSLPIISVGYVPNPHGVGIAGIFMTHIKGHAPQWVHRLDDNSSAQNSEPTILPIAPYDSSSPATGTTFRAKDGAKRKSRDAGEGSRAG